MPDALETQIAHLKNAIDSLEIQRGILGDQVVDTAIEALKQQLNDLQPEQQRKQATILFMDIADHTRMISGLDPEENYEIIDQALVRLEQPVIDAGGRITRATGDGFKALFGHPTAHDNDPEMAIRAAFAILKVTEAYAAELKQSRGIQDFKTRIGIDTGTVLIGGVSEGLDTVKGDAVNMAFRLELQAPPNGILISQNTHRLVRGKFEFEELPPMHLKGFEQPVIAYSVLQMLEESFTDPTRGVEGIETPLVGRSKSFSDIRSELQKVLDGQGSRMVTVMGNAGLGKSRLMYEFEKKLPKNVIVLKGRSVRERQDIPYAVFRNLFSRKLEIRETDAVEEIHQKFEAEIARIAGPSEDARMRAHFIGQLLGFDFSQSPFLEGVLVDTRQLSDRAKNYLIEYFLAVSEASPCVILLEDVHWADDPSLDLQQQLIEILSAQKFFILCNARPDLIERRNLWSAMNPSCTIHRLEPLERKDSRKLVGKILKKAETVPLIVQEFIVSGAEGNPFYIEELIKMLIENGVIMKESEGWQIEQTRLLELEVPPTLTGVIQARLDSLSPLERTLLQQSSVLGRNFWDGVLFRINATPGEDSTDRKIQEALDVLLEKEMIYHRRQSAFAGFQEYAFKHALTREVTYESVLKRMRPVYHGLIAEWLIENGSENAGQFTSLIASHLEKAGQHDQAAGYYFKAGEQSMKQYANQEAIQYLTRALDLLPETEAAERFDILKSRIQIFSLTGNRKGQKKDLVQLAEIARGLGDDHRRGESALLQAMLASDQSEYLKIIKYSKKAIDYGQAADSPRLEGHGHQLWGRALISMGDYDAAKTHLERALELAQTSSLSQVEADSLRFLGNLAQNRETPEEAKNYFERSLEISQRIGDRRGEVRALISLGNISLLMVSYEEGEAYFGKVVRISQEIGDLLSKGSGNRAFGDIFRQRADYRKASEYTNQAMVISEETGNKTLDMNSRFNLGTIAMERSEFTEAGHHFNDVLDLAQGIGNRPMEGRALREIGRFFHRQGDYIRAMNYYQQSLILFEQQNNRRSINRALAFIGFLNLHLGNLEEAHTALEQSLDWIKGMKYPREKGFALTLLAHVHRSEGNLDEAKNTYQEAVALFDSIGESSISTDAITGLASVQLALGHKENAMVYAERVLQIMSSANETEDIHLTYIPGLEGSHDPLAIGWQIYEVLSAAGDPRAEPLIVRLKNVLQKQTGMIDDVDLQQAFVNNIQTHRQISRAFGLLTPEVR